MNSKTKKEVPANQNDPLSKLYSFPADSRLWKELLEAARTHPGAMRAPHYHIDCPNMKEGMLINQLFLKEFITGWELKNPHTICEQDFASGDTKYLGSVDFWSGEDGASREHRQTELNRTREQQEYEEGYGSPQQHSVGQDYKSQPYYQHMQQQEDYYDTIPQQYEPVNESVDNMFVNNDPTNYPGDEFRSAPSLSPQGLQQSQRPYTSSRQESYKTPEGRADLDEKLKNARARHREMTNGTVAQYSHSPKSYSSQGTSFVTASPAGSHISNYQTPGRVSVSQSSAGYHSPTQYSPTATHSQYGAGGSMPVGSHSPVYRAAASPHSPGYVTASPHSPQYSSFSPTYTSPTIQPIARNAASYSTSSPITTSSGGSDLERRVAALERGFRECERRVRQASPRR